MKRIVSIILLPVILLFMAGCNTSARQTEHFLEYFDTVTTLVGVPEKGHSFAEDAAKVEAELARYHRLFDIYHAYEGVENLHTLNEKRKLTDADPAIIELLTFAKEMYADTKGRLNIAMGSVLVQWQKARTDATANPDGATLPSEDALWLAAAHIRVEDIVIEGNDVRLADPELLVDVGAVAKGFAAGKIIAFMRAAGMTRYTLSIGGNVCALEGPAEGRGWEVGIENPDKSEGAAPTIATLSLQNTCLVTSGSYQRYFEVGGLRYHHIIDPFNLRPAKYFTSVSVLATDSATADALSTALFCMTYEEGKALAEEIGVEVLWVDCDGQQMQTPGFPAQEQ